MHVPGHPVGMQPHMEAVNDSAHPKPPSPAQNIPLPNWTQHKLTRQSAGTSSTDSTVMEGSSVYLGTEGQTKSDV